MAFCALFRLWWPMGYSFFLITFFLCLPGYYDVQHIVTALAFMALCRVKTAEQLRFEISRGAGETTRSGSYSGSQNSPATRLKACVTKKTPLKWMLSLSKFWMENNKELAGVLYIDGHVRVYNGDQVKLPRRFVSRENSVSEALPTIISMMLLVSLSLLSVRPSMLE